jgi:SOS response regulatory protein OraA/RecX
LALLHALKMLEKSARSVSEIERALTSRGHDAAEIEAVLGQLRAYGYLDDQGVAQLERERTIDRQKYGKARLAQRLEARGVDEGVISEQINSLADADELSRACQIIEKRDPQRGESPVKIARWLASRGFEEETIESALDRMYPTWRD